MEIAIDLPLPARNGALLAIRQANAADNGVEGWRVQPVVVDPPSRDPRSAVANLGHILPQRRVLALIGGWDNAIARAQLPVADRDSQLVVLSPTADDPCLTIRVAGCPPGEPASLYPVINPLATDLRVSNFFRVATRADTEGPASADYAYNLLDARKAFFIQDGGAAAKLFADTFQHRFLLKGGKPVGDVNVHFSPDGVPDPSLASALAKAQAAAPDLVVFGGTDVEAGNVKAQMRGRLDVPLVGSQAIRSDGFLKAAGAAADGAYASVPRADIENLDPAQDFLHDYRQAYPNPSDLTPAAAYAYDATGAVLAVLRARLKQRPLPPTRDELRRAMGSLNLPTEGVAVIPNPSFTGSLGRLRWDDNGDPSIQVVSFYVVGAGKWTFQDQQSYRG